MKFDFCSVPDRSKFGSSKWNIAPNASTEFVPLSVADMEFPTARPIVDDIKRIADEAILGYTVPTDKYNKAVVSWMKRRHDFEIKEEWMLQTPGIINALALLIQTVTKPDEGVIIMSPVYYPFDMAVVANGRRVVHVPLKHENDRYEINFELLEERAKEKNNTAVLLCNPHNPIGKVWSEEELRKTADICCDNGVFIIDDEIHNDLIMPGYKHTVTAKVSERAMNNIAVCTAPSKTFNLAGLQCSNIIIPNDEIRAKVKACNLINMQMHLNIFAYTACTSAYNKCEEWLDELITVIDGNAKCVEKFMAENFPEIKVYPLEGTYLQWLDVRGLGFNHCEMRELLEGANIYLDNGEMFGALGRGFQRINLACARTTLEKMLIRFKNAVEEYRKNGRKSESKKLEIGDKLEGIELGGKKTMIVFAREIDCSLTKKVLDAVKNIYPEIKASGAEIKAVVLSDEEKIKEVCNYPFEIIADPEASLYKKYEIFEADSAVNAVSGDKEFEKIVLNDAERNALIKVFGFDKNSGFRPLQLFAFIVADENKNVIYSYYSKTILDIPDINYNLFYHNLP